MNIGILSMQEVANYGSFLQAFGLKSTLERLGHNVVFLNIIPGEQLPEYKRGRFHKIKLGLSRIICKNPWKQIYYSLLLHKRFNNEFFKELGVEKANEERVFDVVVIGSDEVFNIAQSSWFGFSPQLFGENINAKKIISYAACCGATTIKKITDLGLYKRVSDLLKSNFDAISVRDVNSFELVKALTGNIPEINIDPVLLYDFSQEVPKTIPHTGTKYMIIYSYPNRMRNPVEIRNIKDYARKNNLKIISMGDYFDWVDEVVTPHPFEVLAYFRDATCIVTDTFHGTIMSIKYNKPFVTYVREMNHNKLYGLLAQFKLTDRIVNDDSSIESVMNQVIDYSAIDFLINTEVEKGIKYLGNNIRSNKIMNNCHE